MFIDDSYIVLAFELDGIGTYNEHLLHFFFFFLNEISF